MKSESSATTSSATGEKNARGFVLPLAFAVVITAIVFGSYGLAIVTPPRLDEMFLINWLLDVSRNRGESSDFYAWPGFAPVEHWGPLTHAALIWFSAIAGKGITAWRLKMIALHAFNALLVALVGRKAGMPRLMAIAAAVIFALYPLCVDAVTFIGGFGVLQATTATLAAAYFYFDTQSKGLSWLSIGLSAGFFLLALLSTTNVWYLPVILLVYLTNSRLGSKKYKTGQPGTLDITNSMVPLLILTLVASAVLAAVPGTFESFTGKPGDFFSLLKHVFFPINEGMWHSYAKEYRLFYVLYGVIALRALIALWFSPATRKYVIWSAAWIAVGLSPFCGKICQDSFLSGARALYFTAVPFAFLFSACITGGQDTVPRFKRVLLGVSCLLTLALGVVFLRHVWDTNANHREWGRQLKPVLLSIKNLSVKQPGSFFFLRDLPERVAVVPEFNNPGPRAFDAATGMLRSNQVPDGRLKEFLRSGATVPAVMRWEKNLKSFINLDLAPEKSLMAEEMTAFDLSQRLQPGLEFYKNVTLDKKENLLVLDSNSANGPMITLAANELAPLDGDYLRLDCKITAPPGAVAPTIELHWLSYVHENFDRNERFTYTKARINDEQFHPYFLSLRSNGFTTGGRPKVIALGFPAGSRVWIKSMGIQRCTPLAGKLEAKLPASQAHQPSFTPPYYNYPTDPALGFVALPPGTPLEGRYDVSAIPGAKGVLIEISKPNQSFDDANSDHQSSVTFKTEHQKGATGEFSLKPAFAGPGVYSVRVIAVDGENGYVGYFSDPVCYQVPRE